MLFPANPILMPFPTSSISAPLSPGLREDPMPLPEMLSQLNEEVYQYTHMFDYNPFDNHLDPEIDQEILCMMVDV
jgi:hypothetical protein